MKYDKHKRYTCPWCASWFNDPHKLGGHMSGHVRGANGAPKPPKIKCPKCGGEYTTRQGFNGHKAKCKVSVDPMVKVNKGTSQGYLFPNAAPAVVDKPFSCVVCGRKFEKTQGLGSHKKIHDHYKHLEHIEALRKEKQRREDAKAAAPEPKKYLLTYDGEEIAEIGTEKQILDRLKVDADMGDLPDNERDITIYVLDKMIKVEYDRQIKVNLGVGKPVK